MVKPLSVIEKKTTEATYIIFVLVLGITSLLLLIPSCSGISVFSKGEFVYTEALGIVLAYLTLFSIFLLVAYKKIFASNIKKQLVQSIIFIGVTGLGILLLLLVVLSTWIRSDVKTHCQDAKRTYGGDCAEALISMLNDNNQSFRSRNSAIYALGQLADSRALPTLQSYYTGNIPRRESLHKTLSQYELKKAIKWCKEGNITSWMYWDQNNWH